MAALDPRLGRNPAADARASTSGAPSGEARWLIFGSAARFGPISSEIESVRFARTGPLFRQLLRDDPPAIAIVSAPPGGPRELLAAVTERRRRGSLRIILLNEPSDVTGRLDALGLGFDDALPASIDPAELLGRIRMLRGARSAGATNRVRISPDVDLDLAGRRVRRGGSEIHLRPKEFALLALLATDPGRVFSREELLDVVWGTAYRGSPRTVDVHVRWLRAKLEQEPARPTLVRTVRGTGYRLDASDS